MNKKKPSIKRAARTAAKAALPALVLFAAVRYLLDDPDISVQTLLAYTPEDPVLAACVLLALYAVKSVTVVFPLIVLEIAVGHLFPTGAALLVNQVGIGIVMTLPYWVGRFSGMEAMDRLIQKYPKFSAILTRQQDNSFFLCFFLRVISCLPGDIVTMYFGATGTPYLQNLVGGALGVLPGMVLATLLGSSIRDPASPLFWISIFLTVVLSGASIAAYYFYRRRLQRKGLPRR